MNFFVFVYEFLKHKNTVYYRDIQMYEKYKTMHNKRVAIHR